jgi:APA family basic amino acid/polyamine antiporter
MVEQTSLKRSLGLTGLTLYGLGNILGAGIYVLIGKIAASAGYLAPLAFLVASVAAAFTAMSYAEMVARYPLSAGEAIYLREGYGSRWLAAAAGLLIAMAGMVSAAAIARGFAGYLQVFWPVPELAAASGVIIALGVLAAWGISQSVTVAAVITLVEVGGLLLVLWVGRGALQQLPVRIPDMLPGLDAQGWSAITVAAFLAFYAYIGFEDMVNVAEEVKRPSRNLPLAIGIALLTATLLYAGVAVIAVLVVTPERLGESSAPMALVYAEATGEAPHLITLISLFAVINGALIQIIMSSRILYGMARQGWLPAWLGRVHPGTRTPVQATAAVAATIVILAALVPLVGLAALTSTLILIVFALVNLALIRVKGREPRPAGLRVLPVWVPWIGLLSSLGFLLARLAVSGQ